MPIPSLTTFPGLDVFPEAGDEVPTTPPPIPTRSVIPLHPSVPQVYIAGQKIESLADVGGLVISHEWPAGGVGGPVSAQFSLLLPASKRPGWLTKGATGSVRFGSLPLLSGAVADVDWSDGSVTIDGAAREGSTTACLGADGETSSTPDPVIDAAIARGALTWTRPGSISTTPLTDGDSTAKLNSVSDMLAAYADESGARLYVDPWRRLLKGSDPRTPDVFVVPGAGELSWTTDRQATRIIGRWANAAGTLTNTVVGSGAIERLVDMEPLGPLTAARATAVLNSILARASSGGWTGGLTLAPGQLIGAPDLAMVAEHVGRGLMVRLLGQRDPRPDRMPVNYIDFVVERSEWHVADGQITLTPRGMVASDFASILAEAGVQEAS
jgi:hypothetical protein